MAELGTLAAEALGEDAPPEPVAPVTDTRSRIGQALDGKMTDDQISFLMDEVLKITKQGRGWCPNCKKAVLVQVEDAKAVTSAIVDLANQSWGRPGETAGAEQALVVNRTVIVRPVEDDPVPA